MFKLAKLTHGIGFSRNRLKIGLLAGFLLWIYTYVTMFQNRLDKQYVAERNLSVRTSVHGHSSYGHCQSDEFQYFHGAVRQLLPYFIESFKVTQEPVGSWMSKASSYCDGTLRVYDNQFGLVQGVRVDPGQRNNAAGLARGGESVQEVKSQQLSKEDYVFRPGFYQVACTDPQLAATIATATYDKLKQLRVVDKLEEGYKTEERFTVAIARGDYANLWNHVFELYGVFLLMMVFNKQAADISILFLDGHPACLLDKNWEHIFGPVQRVGRLEKPVVYSNLVWGLAENQIPLSKWQNPSCPYIEEFRTFVLNQYGIVEDAKRINCAKLTFTFIIRRNQVYHPRNLEGNVQRKIFNELEVIETLMDRFPGVCIQALLMESIPMRAQLEIISETDVLIGMHGAGLMHTTFLPRHAGVVELFPLHWREMKKFAIMFEKLSKWRGLKYGSWQNPDAKRAFDERVTIVDTEKVYEEVKGVIDNMCSTGKPT